MVALTRAGVLTNYVEIAQHLGINPHRMLQSVGLSESLIREPEQRIPSVAAITLLEESARVGNCPTLGLRMAESRQLSDFGAISLMLRHQATLRQAIAATIQYRHLLNDALAIYLEEDDKTVIIREEVVTDLEISSRQSIELALGVMCRLCTALLGGNWHPLGVKFTHDAPPDLQLHRRVFRSNLEFGAEFNGIVCSAAELDKPNPLADPALANHAKSYLDSLSAHDEHSALLDTRKAICLLLPMGRANIEQVAATQGMNVRTLQRRLDEQGVTFSDLVNGVRRELAIRYMRNENYSISQIADLLGYSMPSSFTRWFISQFGKPPAIWRKEINTNQQ